MSAVSHTLCASFFLECLPCRLGNQTAVSRRRVPPRLKISVITGVPGPPISSSGAESEAESILLFLSHSGSGGSCFTTGRPESTVLLGQLGSNTGEVRTGGPRVQSSWASTFSCFTCNRDPAATGVGPGTCTGLLAPPRRNTRSVPGGGSTKSLPASSFIGVGVQLAWAVDLTKGASFVGTRRVNRAEPGLLRRRFVGGNSIPSSGPGQTLGSNRFMANCRHWRQRHFWRFWLLPPNLGLSQQKSQWPQSIRRKQASQVPHLRFCRRFV